MSRYRDGQLREIRILNNGALAEHQEISPATTVSILTEWYYNIVGIYMYRNQFYAINQDDRGYLTVYHAEFPLVINERPMTDYRLRRDKAALQDLYVMSALYHGYPSETEVFEYSNNVYVLYWYEDRVTVYTAEEQS
jgi:hypothetical protein